jgi:hypothetical protein
LKPVNHGGERRIVHRGADLPDQAGYQSKVRAVKAMSGEPWQPRMRQCGSAAGTDDPPDDRSLSRQAAPAVIALLTIIRFTLATFSLIK